MRGLLFEAVGRVPRAPLESVNKLLGEARLRWLGRLRAGGFGALGIVHHLARHSPTTSPATAPAAMPERCNGR